MSVTDPIADMLAILRNGVMARKEDVLVKRSKLNESVMGILKKEGFILNYKPIEDKKQGLLKVYLKYAKNNTSALSGLKRISKPSRRIYVKNEEIKEILGGIGISLISTSHGVMTGKEAKMKKIGGEALCHIW